MEKLISYIRQKYAPWGIIVYGSYADGSNGENSDFDALVITNDQPACHDTAVIEGVQLDVFTYPRDYVAGNIDLEEVLQIFDGLVVLDTDGLAERLKQRVVKYLNNRPQKSKQQVREQICWCRKMVMRTRRMDAEGMFRWHWLLIDSLEIFCDKVGQFYFGPKKTLKWMQNQYPEAFQIYKKALSCLEEQSLVAWIDYLEQDTDG